MPWIHNDQPLPWWPLSTLAAALPCTSPTRTGAGHTAIGPVFATLRSMGCEGYVSAEILPLPDPYTAAERTALFLRAHL